MYYRLVALSNQIPLISQNFLTSQKLINKLVRESSISSKDMVLEIGPGRGIITRELLKITNQVVAIEIDPKFRYPAHPYVYGDFLTLPLPKKPYKVFSNIPFNITGDIIRKLLQSDSPPSDSYLIMQKQAAVKFIANDKSNTMAAILYYPWWDIHITHRFKKTDFSPPPQVDCVLLRIQAKSIPLFDPKYKQIYQDFISYHFGRDKNSKYTSPRRWLAMFGSYDGKSYQGSFAKLLQQQSSLHKIHRTRTDKNWKRFK